MSSYLQYIIDGGDERTKGWFLIDSPVPVFSILLAYYMFVTKIGPWLMKDRPPLNIKPIMQAYNVLQVAICLSYLSYYSYYLSRVNLFCWERYTNPVVDDTCCLLGWVYYMLKFVDLIDTVFLVLRKKSSHITFLHLFHHMSMVVVSWVLMKHIASGVLGIGPGLNMVVHAFMYSYFFAIIHYGTVNNIWKKLMTQIQLAQFLFGTTIFIIHACNPNCGFPKLLLIPIICHGLSFIYLFSKFYYVTYIKDLKAQPDKQT